MNLVLFTIEVERDTCVDSSNNARRHGAARRRLARLRSVGLGILAGVVAIVAGWSGWLFADGDPIGVDGFDSLAFVTPVIAAGREVQPKLEVISQPAEATVMLDGDRRGSTPLVLAVSQSIHTLLLKHPDALDEQQPISVLGGRQCAYVAAQVA